MALGKSREPSEWRACFNNASTTGESRALAPFSWSRARSRRCSRHSASSSPCSGSSAAPSAAKTRFTRASGALFAPRRAARSEKRSATARRARCVGASCGSVAPWATYCQVSSSPSSWSRAASAWPRTTSATRRWRQCSVASCAPRRARATSASAFDGRIEYRSAYHSHSPSKRAATSSFWSSSIRSRSPRSLRQTARHTSSPRPGSPATWRSARRLPAKATAAKSSDDRLAAGRGPSYLYAKSAPGSPEISRSAGASRGLSAQA